MGESGSRIYGRVEPVLMRRIPSLARFSRQDQFAICADRWSIRRIDEPVIVLSDFLHSHQGDALLDYCTAVRVVVVFRLIRCQICSMVVSGQDIVLVMRVCLPIGVDGERQRIVFPLRVKDLALA